MRTQKLLPLVAAFLVAMIGTAEFRTIGSEAALLAANPTPLTVGPAGATFTGIQAAVDAATPGQIVEVRSGTYRENVTVNKPIILRGVDAGGGKPVVDAGGRGSAITLAADSITLEGFQATGSGRKFGDVGILVTSNHNIIRGNIAYNNHTGIMLRRCKGNTLDGNDAGKNLNDGICLVGAARNTIANNIANANKHAGIWLDSHKSRGPLEPADHNTLLENTADANGSFGIALNTGANDNTIRGNRVSGNQNAGILVNCGPMRNVVAGNRVRKNLKTGILLTAAGFQNSFVANQIHENDRGIEVLSSSGNAFTSNQVVGNRSYGIRVDQMSPMHMISTMCVFSRNNLIDNPTNAHDASGNAWQPPANMPAMNPETMKSLSAPNRWDDQNKGNHYSDFTKPSEGCVDANRDGVSDHPHPIPGGKAVDRFPLVSPEKNDNEAR